MYKKNYCCSLQISNNSKIVLLCNFIQNFFACNFTQIYFCSFIWHVIWSILICYHRWSLLVNKSSILAQGSSSCHFLFQAPPPKKALWPILQWYKFHNPIDRLDQGDIQSRVGKTEFHFPNFFPKFWSFLSYVSSNFSDFLPHFGPIGERVAHPGRPWLMAMPLGLHLDLNNPWLVHLHVVQIFTNTVGKIGEWEAPGKFWCWKGNFQKCCLFVHKNTLQIVRRLASFLGNKQVFLLCPLKKTNKQTKTKTWRGLLSVFVTLRHTKLTRNYYSLMLYMTQYHCYNAGIKFKWNTQQQYKDYFQWETCL